MILGYLSVEWLALTIVGLSVSFILSTKAVIYFNSNISLYILAVISTILFYSFLRMAGKTPIGIVIKSHPAAKGHPLLSILASLLFISFWLFKING